MESPPRAQELPKRQVRHRLKKALVEEHRCEWCGQWFESSVNRQRFCSRSHRSMATRARRKLLLLPPTLAYQRVKVGRKAVLIPTAGTDQQIIEALAIQRVITPIALKW